MRQQTKTRFMVQFAILLAIEAIFCFTPLGSLPALGPIVATLAHVPVILTAIVMGTAAGCLMGLCTGIFSLLIWTFMPPAQSVIIAFVFSPAHSFGEVHGNLGSVLISIIPRVMVGLVAGLVYQAMSRRGARDWLRYGLAGVLASLVNTLGVMGGIWLFFGSAYAAIVGQAILLVVGSTVLFSGIPEAVVGGLSALFIARPLQKARQKAGN